MFYSKIIITVLNLFDYFQQKNILKLFKKKIQKPIILFDIGAHHGETIKLFLNNLRVKKIYSFEASPKNFGILEKNITAYKNKKIEIFNYGLGDITSKKYINHTLESSSSSINRFNSSSKYFKKKLKVLKISKIENYSKKILIKINTLDQIIKKKNIKKIDILKIDTEGYEFNILKGLSKLNKIVRFIYFEHHYDDMIIKNYKFSDIHRLLRKYNFKMIKKSKMCFRKSFEYVYENQI